MAERTLEDIKEDLRIAREHVRALEDERERYVLARAGVAVGDFVFNRRKKKYGRVIQVDASEWRGKPWIVVNEQRADGTMGTGRRNWFGDWERADQVEAPVDGEGGSE